jgi:starch synthase
MVTRLTAQKGLELIERVLPDLLRERDMRFVVLGSGEPRYEEFFFRMRRTYPGKVHFHNGFSNDLAHLIEAGADAFLMPSHYEPCGLNQMYSLRYGTVPIVRKTGGLADTVDLYDPETGEGTGIAFEHYNVAGLRWAILAALDLYKNKKVWEKIARSGMSKDFSWEKQGAVYVELYRRLIASPKF